MKLLICLIIAVAIAPRSFAQSKIDSLRIKLRDANAGKQVEQAANILSSIGWEFFTQHQFDSALVYFYGALGKGKTVADPRFAASIYSNLGVIYSDRGIPDSCIYYYLQALERYHILNDTTNSITVETNLSIVFKDLGLYEKSLETAFSALVKLERQKPGRALGSCYNTLGVVYWKIGEYENALKYHKQALSVRKEIGYSKGIGHSYNNIGLIYIAENRLDSALLYLNLAADMKRQAGDEKGLFSTINNLGEVSFGLGGISNARIFFQQSLEMSQREGNLEGQITALNNLGKVYLATKEYLKARTFLDRADVLISKTSALDHRRANLELKERLFKETGDFRLSLKTAEELIVVKDSLLDKEKAESLVQMQTQYDTEKKEQHIALLETEKALQLAELKANQLWITGFIVGTILLLTVILLVWNQYRVSQKNKRKVELLLRELHHRVKNNLQILSSLFLLQSQQLLDRAAIDAVKSSEGRVNAMALIHQKLYIDEENRAINLKEYITELIEYLKSTYGYAQSVLKVNLTLAEISLDVDKAIPLGLIINELVSNAFKHAYGGQSNPQLNVVLQRQHKNDLTMEISDNGLEPMLESQLGSSGSFGFAMVKMLLRELKGSLNVSTANGTGFFLTIPMS
jgi:two-component sensor histidine kinase